MSIFSSRSKELAIQLTEFGSITNSQGEKNFATHFKNVLSSWDYFQKNPQHVWTEKTLDDTFERSSLFALVKGKGEKTIILTGHFDTVSTENYGMLQPFACKPTELLAELVTDLRKSGTNPQALQEFESGDFLPGRGMLDMKSGLAVGLALLEEWSKLPNPPGNLLFITVPDEEVASHGMKSVVQQLPEVCKKFELRLELAINLDVSAEAAIFLGSVGKLLPFVLFVGRPTHVGAPFDGVNPALLASEFVSRLESNPMYGDAAGRKDYPAPPTVLYQRDNRTHYDVTTPASSFCAVNVLTHHRTPQDVLEMFQTLAKESLESTLQKLTGRAKGFVERTDIKINFQLTPTVITFADLLARAKAVNAKSVEKILRETLPNAEVVDRCNAITQELVKLASLEGPAAVIGFAPPYYSRSECDTVEDSALLDIIKGEIKATPYPISIRPFFDGISDMSFFCPTDGHDAQGFVASHMPVLQTVVENKLSCPIVNVGPWGKDYHQRLERVHMPYAFEVLPDLLWRILHEIAKSEA
ncbi:MAG: M20/M25/M40 family metallo-hydrolase [Trueperaceae bacterium]